MLYNDLSYALRSLSFPGADVYFALFLAVENMFISYLLIFNNFVAIEYIIQNNKVFLINNLFIT